MKKRVLSLILAALTLLAFCAPAFAAEEPAVEPEASIEEAAPAEEPVPAEEEVPAEEPVEEPAPVAAEPVDEPEEAAATSGSCGEYGDNVQWSLSNGTLTISGIGRMKNYTEEIDGMWYPDMPPWFDYYDSSEVPPMDAIKRIVIESGVTSIGDLAFFSCYNAASITIPDTVTSIGRDAFYECAFTNVTIPESVTTIKAGAFTGCKSLVSINIPSGIKAIELCTFGYCYSLKSITIPSSVTSIGTEAFWDCYRLENVDVPSSVKSIGAAAFEGCVSLETLTVRNPKCEIMTHQADVPETELFLAPDTTIFQGYDGSTLETYCKERGFTFVSLGKAPGETTEPSPAPVKDGWKKDAAGWHYYEAGEQVKADWVTDAGEKYYIDDKGVMVTGWKTIDGVWYNFGKSGAMVSDDWLKDGSVWYFMDPDGKMLEGLSQIDLGRADDGWYYFSEKHDGTYGHVMAGWQKINDTWYYFNPKHNGTYGKMVSNDWLKDGGVWYFMDPDGKMLEGLSKIDLGRADDGLYYFSEKHDGTYGHVLDGWQKIDDVWYYFNPKHNGTYGRAYVDGTFTIDGKSYTFDADGKLVS